MSTKVTPAPTPPTFTLEWGLRPMETRPIHARCKTELRDTRGRIYGTARPTQPPAME